MGGVREIAPDNGIPVNESMRGARGVRVLPYNIAS